MAPEKKSDGSLACQLCGMEAQLTSKICSTCEETFPSAKQCKSCKRFFPKQEEHFAEGKHKCIYCMKRKTSKHTPKNTKREAPTETLTSLPVKKRKKNYIELHYKGKSIGKLVLD